MGIVKEYFGSLNGEHKVYKFILRNKRGMEVALSNYGAIVTNIYIPIKNEKIDVVLGYDNLEAYTLNPKFFGATIGPNCNRISNSKFILNNKEYMLEKNDNDNNLHSGSKAFHKVLWDYNINEEENYIEFSYLKADQELGFPGNLNVKVVYQLTQDNQLKIHYEGFSDKDTIINLTNHTYFNLSGHKNQNATNQYLWINSNYFTPVKNQQAIPTGELKSVRNTPMDFTTMKKINKDIEENYEQLKFVGGYDHNYKINKQSQGIELVAKLYSEDSNINMELYSDTLGVQFYSGNSIEGGPIGKDSTTYQDRSGICLETQYFPDAINNENFKSPILKTNEKYTSTTIYKFLTN